MKLVAQLDKTSPIFYGTPRSAQNFLFNTQVLTTAVFISLMMQNVSTPETSVNFYRIMRRNILEDCGRRGVSRNLLGD